MIEFVPKDKIMDFARIMTTFLGAVAVPLAILFLILLFWAIHDIFFQREHAIRHNFPVIGSLRYILESVGPELRQYFFSDDTGDRPISRYVRNWIYRSAKGADSSLPFGTKLDISQPGTILFRHSPFPGQDTIKPDRVLIGPGRRHPYAAQRFNVSAMSYGSLGRNAILALSMGAKTGGFSMNTGEGGISPYHLQGGADLCWQIGTGKFGCRTQEGNFYVELFQENARRPEVKLIEIKLSQGAKPGKGGVLPQAKITEEIARIRNIPRDRDCISPPAHREWNDVKGLLDFIWMLQEESGKPVGIKMCVGDPAFVGELADAIRTTGRSPDFITIDGKEGGTGAAPLSFSDRVGYPLREALILVDDTFRTKGVRDKIRLIASAKIFTGAELAMAIALGADMAQSARGFMLSIGCIHALRCAHNTCPAGVATHHPWLQAGLDPYNKAPRVTRYQAAVIKDMLEIVRACGLKSPSELDRHHLMMVAEHTKIVGFDELHPSRGPRPAAVMPEPLTAVSA
ncbi:MAG: FMN-binding glutamate synthase family protein [Deltaproteobacteria bacterium]|nr:FMN-binding glutamate synthase family protein [Deltaproteobacteria bacterium]